MSEAVMKCSGLQKWFEHPAGRVHVLKGIDFTLEKGKMTAILGRSGIGKSTFLHILGTLDSASSGHVMFGDTDLFKLKDREISAFRNRHMGFVFQFHYLLPEFTALENVMMPALISGQSQNQAMGRAKELLHVVHLDHRLSHRPSELSGGEQQRVSLARALMMSPEVVFTDELTGNLDSQTGQEVLSYLRTLNQLFQVTVLSVTHQRQSADDVYDRLFVMEDGLLRQLTSAKDPSLMDKM